MRDRQGMQKSKESARELPTRTHRIETRLDDRTLQELDQWRSAQESQPTRSEAARLLLEERLCLDRDPAKVEPPWQRSCPDKEHLGAIYALEQVSGFGPAKFRAMYESGVDALVAIENPSVLPFTGRTGEKLQKGIEALSDTDLAVANERAADQLERADRFSASILVHGDTDYPERVYASNNPVPVLYVRGDPKIWREGESVAVVGSRETREPYAEAARMFASVAAHKGVLIVSGFAIGADSIGHFAAYAAGGRTICVMPCGLDLVFPPENRELWQKLLAYPNATFVSEFGFGLRASSLLLRKRNKLIVAFSHGVLVAQSALDGGAMNAYRFGREQKKPVATFRSDGSKETLGNALISEDRVTGACAFESTCNESKYETWLHQLSSSI